MPNTPSNDKLVEFLSRGAEETNAFLITEEHSAEEKLGAQGIERVKRSDSCEEDK
jgi:hypothetical protein